MKNLLTIALLLGSVAALSACQATARDKDTSVSVSTGEYHHGHDDGYFCPPGQAKKGRC
jgi:hypothetical protein